MFDHRSLPAAALALAATLPAAAATVDGVGVIDLVVEDSVSPPQTATHDVLAPGSQSFGVGTEFGAIARATYDYQASDAGASLTVTTRHNVGAARGASTAEFHFDFTLATWASFDFRALSENALPLPTEYRAEFNGVVAESVADIAAENGVAGNIAPGEGFQATGLLAPGQYAFTIDSFTGSDGLTGAATASLVLTAMEGPAPAPAPLPAAGVMGLVTLCVASLSTSRRRRH